MTLNSNEKNTGSVPNILEHPDIRRPIVMENQQLSLSSSSSSSSTSSNSNDRRKLYRQQSGKEKKNTTYSLKYIFTRFTFFSFTLADVYSTLARTTSPTNPKRSTSPGSIINNITESPEQEKV